MKEITWQFVTGASAASSLIRWKTDSEISHVNVVTPDGKLLGALMDGGIEVREHDYEKFSLQILVTVPVSDEQYDAFWHYMYAQVGGKYDSAGILGIALGNNMHNANESFCSEYQSRGVAAAKIVWIAKDPSKVDPEMLRVILTAIPNAKELRKAA